MEQHKTGTLYLCATPIGNLEDITYRVLRTLKEVDLIAAEDTRNSIRLLNHFEIKTPMTSYHEYNKIDKAYQLVAKMREGKNIALITDAGTPGISDPGEDIVRICYEEGIPVTSLPGAAACIRAAGQGTPSAPRRTELPSTRATGSASVPMRSSGPCRSISSWRMPAARIMASQSVCAASGPWERFMRMPVMPASTMCCKIAGCAQAGPMVP